MIIDCSCETTPGIVVYPERTTYVSAVPATSAGRDGDQAVVVSGNLHGAIYEKQAGAWVYVGAYHTARSVWPTTDEMPTGFQFRMVLQSNTAENGLWEWDGYNLYQLQ